MSIVSVMPPNHLILCRTLLLRPSIFPSIRIFPNESVLHIRWPKDWSFSFSISPSNEYSGVISFRMDGSDLLESRDSQESSPTPQFKSINSLEGSIFIVQLIHPYMATGKTIALTRWNFVNKVRSLLFNMMSQFSCSVVSDSLRPHEAQHTRPPCSSPTPRVHSNSCPSSR